MLQGIGSEEMPGALRIGWREGTYHCREDIAIGLWLCQQAYRFQFLHEVAPEVSIYFCRCEPVHQDGGRERLSADHEVGRLMNVITIPGYQSCERGLVDAISVYADEFSSGKGAFAERDLLLVYTMGRI